MARAIAIAQPLVSGHTHAKSLANLLSVPWATEFMLSTAYVNAAGVKGKEVATALAKVGDRCRVFLGIRNGSSTCQGALALLAAGAELYVVDTATATRIFHPKIYLALGIKEGLAIVGSSNLTHAGLNNNIEIGAQIHLDLTNAADATFVRTIVTELNKLPKNFPENCYRVTRRRDLVELMRDGLLEDERSPKADTAAWAGKGRGKKGVKPIGLPLIIHPQRRTRRVPTSSVIPPPVSIVPSYGPLVWQKPKLPDTDLQLNTNSSVPGVIRLTQAKFKVGGKLINHLNYFRNQVFGTLAWAVDPSDPGKDMAKAKFTLVIVGVYIGDFDLRLSYKPAWASGQGNYTTGLHLDGAVGHIKDPALKGRTLSLYAPASAGLPYTIEIN